MYASWFGYNITRPFPFRWFTPVAVVGGIVFAVLFSLLNLAANGFYLTTQYTVDPNTTVKDGNSPWYLRAPFNWDDNLRADCVPVKIYMGYQFFTTNLGLKYEVTGISQSDKRTGKTTQLESVAYLNNTLDNCRMDNVQINLRKADNSRPPGFWSSWDDSFSTATASCTITTPNGPIDIHFTTPFSTPLTSFSYIVQDNYTTYGSRWWGTRLLNLYWYGLLVVTAHVSTQDNPPDNEWFVKGMLSYSSNGTDVKQDDYFDLNYYFLQSGGFVNNTQLTLGESYNNRSNIFWKPMTEGLQFAKILRSLLTVDLGNNAMPNLLLDDELLQYAIYSPNDDNRHVVNGERGDLNYTARDPGAPDWRTYNGINWPGTSLDPNNRTLLNETYPLFKNEVGPLGTKPATIYTEYACSIPTRKNMGTLVLAVIIADLVFLQAIWHIYKLAAEGLVYRTDPSANICAGCVGQEYTSLSLEPYRKNARSETESSLRLAP